MLQPRRVQPEARGGRLPGEGLKREGTYLFGDEVCPPGSRDSRIRFLADPLDVHSVFLSFPLAVKLP